MEQEFLKGLDTDKVNPFVEQCIAQKESLITVSFALCLFKIDFIVIIFVPFFCKFAMIPSTGRLLYLCEKTKAHDALFFPVCLTL